MPPPSSESRGSVRSTHIGRGHVFAGLGSCSDGLHMPWVSKRWKGYRKLSRPVAQHLVKKRE